jgi:hypothetical protein
MYIYIYIYMCVCVCVCVFVCVYIYICVCVCVCLCVCVYIYIYMCVCVCVAQEHKPDLGLLALRFLDHTQFTHIHSVGLLCIRDRPVAEAYLATYNTHKRQTPMPPAGFEPSIPASERPQTHVLDRTATRIGVP